MRRRRCRSRQVAWSGRCSCLSSRSATPSQPRAIRRRSSRTRRSRNLDTCDAGRTSLVALNGWRTRAGNGSWPERSPLPRRRTGTTTVERGGIRERSWPARRPDTLATDVPAAGGRRQPIDKTRSRSSCSRVGSPRTSLARAPMSGRRSGRRRRTSRRSVSRAEGPGSPPLNLQDIVEPADDGDDTRLTAFVQKREIAYRGLGPEDVPEPLQPGSPGRAEGRPEQHSTTSQRLTVGQTKRDRLAVVLPHVRGYVEVTGSHTRATRV